MLAEASDTNDHGQPTGSQGNLLQWKRIVSEILVLLPMSCMKMLIVTLFPLTPCPILSMTSNTVLWSLKLDPRFLNMTLLARMKDPILIIIGVRHWEHYNAALSEHEMIRFLHYPSKSSQEAAGQGHDMPKADIPPPPSLPGYLC